MQKKIITIIATVLIVAALALGINWLLTPKTSGGTAPATKGATSSTPDQPPADLVLGDPLAESGLRFNGVYHVAQEDIHYYMRFYPKGHATLIGGPEQPGGPSLRMYLKASMLSQRAQGMYNLPVQWRGDSLFMTAKGPKGDLLYSGRIEGPDDLTFLKESKANGKRALLKYHFEVDSAAASVQ